MANYNHTYRVILSISKEANKKAHSLQPSKIIMVEAANQGEAEMNATAMYPLYEVHSCTLDHV